MPAYSFIHIHTYQHKREAIIQILRDKQDHLDYHSLNIITPKVHPAHEPYHDVPEYEINENDDECDYEV